MTSTDTTINPKHLAYDAMQEAIAYIQKQLGITAGDFAGVYFSDDTRETTILEVLTDYACEEMRRASKPFFVNDEWVCECGNQPHLDGFQPCVKSGKIVWPTKETWTDGSLYRCLRCGTIIEVNADDHVGQIVGMTVPEFLEQTDPDE